MEKARNIACVQTWRRSWRGKRIPGESRVTICDHGENTQGKEIFVHEGESVFVPKGKLRRLENPGKIFLEIIEVQIGEYVGEDDIERVDDDFRRTS
jgi:mannose-6-phosphate isomerase-like protein (cupin superfamily)